MSVTHQKLINKLKDNVSIIDLMVYKKGAFKTLLDLHSLYNVDKKSVLNYLKNNKPKIHKKPTNTVFPKEIREFRNRMMPDSGYAQLYADDSTMINKINLLKKQNNHKVKEIFILGDDDMLGLLIAENLKDKNITVLDIDHKIVNYINSIAKNKGYNIKAHLYDVNNSLPDTFLRKFDYFIFDSSHCLGGYVSFLMRSLNALNEKAFGGQFIFQLENDLPVFTNCERKKLLRFIKDHGLKVNKIRRCCVRYEIPEKIITEFKNKIVELFDKNPSKESIYNFLLKFGFSEFLPGVCQVPEAIIEIKCAKIIYPKNESFSKELKKKYGEMYFYLEYDK
jgi:predicted methyltransferase